MTLNEVRVSKENCASKEQNYLSVKRNKTQSTGLNYFAETKEKKPILEGKV